MQNPFGSPEEMTRELTLPETQIAALKQRTPADFKYERPGLGGKTFTYVDIGYVTGRLNQIFGSMWSFEIKDKFHSDKEAWVLGVLRVLCEDGKVITKEQFGSSAVKGQSLGDDLKAAASDSLKKCASMLGLAADVYFPKTWEKVEAMKANLPSPEHS